jgi:hypothetical protein
MAGQIIRRAFFTLAAVALLFAGHAEAACSGSGTSWSCTAGTTIAEVNSALASAADGATLTFAAGAYTWTTGSITLKNSKGVTLACATIRGCTVALANNRAIYMDALSGSNTKLYRVSGFVFRGATSSAVWWYSGNGTTPSTMHNCRIDHNTFDSFGLGQIAILLGGGSVANKFKCLIDNNIFSGTNNFMGVKVLGAQTPDAYASSVRGTADNVFLEDNTFNFAMASDLGTGCLDAWNGAAVVVRHNDSTNCLWTAHGVTHKVVVNFEFYQNNLRRVGAGTWNNGTRLFHHQGSGEIFVWGNTWHVEGKIATPLSITHYRSAEPAAAGYSEALGRCDGDNVLDGNVLPNGYPCWMQPGRAPAGGSPGYGTLSPVYIWMNVDNATGNRVFVSRENPWGATNPSVADHFQANRDYYDAVSNVAQTSPTSPFDGTTGMGFGTLANRPTTCTTSANEAGGGVAYWTTNEGEWDSTHAGADGRLYRCSATNTWTLHYTPYLYPHPLRSGDNQPAPPSKPARPTGLRIVP